MSTKTIKIACTGASVLDLNQIEPFQGNLKELTKPNHAKLKKSLLEYGFSFPVFIWRHDGHFFTIDGHQRLATLKLMREEGYEVPALPVDWIEALDEKEAKQKILLAVGQFGNVTKEGLYEFASTAGIDMAWLRESITLPEINFDRFEANFGAKESAADVPDPQHERADELVKQFDIKAGQLWGLGGHRLLCGDCGDEANLKRLFGQERAILMNTDPPYGVAYDSTASKPDGHSRKAPWEMIENDELVDENIQPFLERCFRALKAWALAPNAAWYLWHAHLTGAFFAAAAAAAAAAADVLLHRQVIWKKPRFIIGMGMYHWSHEPAFMGWVRGNKPPYYGERNQHTVWEIDYDGKKNPTGRIHPTQKPVELFKIPLRNHTKPGEICAEPFSGSGSQIIAAEQLERRCFACEVSPQFVAVSIQRWVDLTGGVPKLVEG